MTPLEIALAYIRRGWNVTPVAYRSKRPLGDGWQLRIVNADNAAEYFNGDELNIGAVLGPTSRKLTDVDMDADVAICIGPYILPRTQARFGRDLVRRPNGEQQRLNQEPPFDDLANAVPCRHVNRH